MRQNRTTRAAAVAVAVASAIVLALAGCRQPAAEPGPDVAGVAALPSAPAGPSWAPRPVLIGGLSAVATAGAAGYRVGTAHGPVGFLAGVNLGGTTPGHQPGELSISQSQYRDWFAVMGRMGVRVVRTYTIHPPAFYTELRRYDTAHPDAPLYLMQGAYLPDESYVAKKNIYDPAVTTAFDGELADAVAAVHGGLIRTPRRGRADGHWQADVSGWLVGWIIGVEWDPYATRAGDARNAHRPGFTGRYFASTPDASPTERWLAARMDRLAAAEAARGRSMPIAFANWPTTDPLRHPEEPLAQEDLVGVDANHVRPTSVWPGGTFASYHAYPYYPDFQWRQPSYGQFRYQGRVDRYAGYLSDLKRHHAAAGIPVLITETGQPSAIGSAHTGPLGRDQGDHSEQEAMHTDAVLLHLVKDVGLSGALLFAWTDEWFKFTWNTIRHQVPERRQLWHDALTNEQWFGLVAMDPLGAANPDPQHLTASGPIRTASARVDEGYVHLDIRFRDRPAGSIILGLDTVPAVTGPPAPGGDDRSADYALVLEPGTRHGQEWIRGQLSALALDDPPPRGTQAAASASWLPLRLVTNRALTIPGTGRQLPAQFIEAGVLRYGTWDPESPGYDVRAIWWLDGDRLRIRLPWAMAGLADPSSHQALLPASPKRFLTVPGVGLSLRVGGQTVGLGVLRWEDWQRVGYQARLKAGAGEVRDALVSTSQR